MKSNPRKILVVQTAFLGDAILSTPLVKAIRELYPDSCISILLTPQTAGVFENNPYLEQIILYDKKGRQRGIRSFLQLTGVLQEERFDLAIIPHRSLRSALLAYLAGIPQRVGFHTSSGSFLYTQEVTYKEGLHEIDRNLSLLFPFGYNVQGTRPQLFPSQKDYDWADSFLSRSGIDPAKQMVGIAPSSVWMTKRWLAESFAHVANRLITEAGCEVLLLGSSQDERLLLKISSWMKEKPILPIGRLGLCKSAALISRCLVILSNDSAPAHMGTALGKNVVAIFGPTLPEFGFAPYGENHTILQKNVYCRPCGIHGRKSCPEVHFRCMTEISSEEVFQAVKKYL